MYYRVFNRGSEMIFFIKKIYFDSIWKTGLAVGVVQATIGHEKKLWTFVTGYLRKQEEPLF